MIFCILFWETYLLTISKKNCSRSCACKVRTIWSSTRIRHPGLWRQGMTIIFCNNTIFCSYILHVENVSSRPTSSVIMVAKCTLTLAPQDSTSRSSTRKLESLRQLRRIFFILFHFLFIYFSVLLISEGQTSKIRFRTRSRWLILYLATFLSWTLDYIISMFSPAFS